MRTQARAQLENDLDERLRGVVEPAVSGVSTIEPFTVLHKLGTKPSMVSVLPYSNCNVWATEEDRRLWNSERVVLRCSVAQTPMTLLVTE